MKNYAYRALAAVMSAAVLLNPFWGFSSVAAHAATTSIFTGSGTKADPYQITSAADLVNFASDVNSGTSYSGMYFQLENSIEVSDWVPAGTSASSYFKGYFDGNQKTVTIDNIASASQSGTYVGLFGYLGGYVYDLTTAGTVTGTSSSGNVGGIAGQMAGGTQVINCMNKAAVNGKNNTGGIVGYQYASSSVPSYVYNCYNSGAITGTGDYYTGGISGKKYYYAYTYYSVNNGTITDTAADGMFAIGGGNGSSSSYIKSCYNANGATLYDSAFAPALSSGTFTQSTIDTWNSSVSGYTSDAFWVLDGNSLPLPSALDTNTYYAVTASLSHVTTTAKTKTVAGKAFSGTFAADDNYSLPDQITVSVGGTVLEASDYTWSAATGTLTIAAEKVTGDISITVTATENPSYTVNVTKDADITVTPSATNSVTGSGAAYSGKAYKFTVASSQNHKISSINVTVGGSELSTESTSGYTVAYNTAVTSADVSIPAAAVTGMITIEAGSVESASYAVQAGTISHAVYSAANAAAAYAGWDLALTITPDTGYSLPQASITVMSGSTQLTAGTDFTYSNNTLTVKGTSITGDITVGATASDVSVWDGTAASVNTSAAFSGGSGTASDPYIIGSASDLAQLAANINSSTTSSAYKAKYYKQITNIDLNSKTWSPIGSSSSLSFGGTYDGGGYQIRNLYINTTSSGIYAGVFGYTATTTVVENVVATGSVTGINYSAGIVSTNYGKVDNCVNYVDVTGKNSNCGGVVGYNSNGTVTGCMNHGSVTVNTGYMTAGGVIGYLYGGTVRNCGNTGTITNDTDATSILASAGGIVGRTSGSNYSYVYNCYNSGNIHASVPTTTNSSTIAGAGGIVGLDATSSTVMLYIENCYNTGTIAATHAGGTAYAGKGQILGAVYSSYKADLKNCYWKYVDGTQVGYQTAVTYSSGTFSGSVTTSNLSAFSDNSAQALSGSHYSSAYKSLVNNLNAWVSDKGTDTYKTWAKATETSLPLLSDSKTVTYETEADTTAPTGIITVGGNIWTEFLNTITFGSYFKETQDVTVTGSDDGSGLSKIYYYVSDEKVSASDIAGVNWTEYTGKISIVPDRTAIVYAKITDVVGNVTYLSSDGLVLDATAPTITGATDGASYCASKTLTVKDANLDTVKVNGEEVALNNDMLTLTAKEGTQTVVATDKAGNAATVAVNIYDGHSWDAGVVTKVPTYTATGIKTYTCSRCGETKIEEIPMLTDTKAPTGSIGIDSNSWSAVQNPVSFNVFFSAAKDIVISGADAESGMSHIYYCLSDKAIDQSELSTAAWTEYTGKIALSAEQKVIVYAKLTDVSGNVSYLSSNGIVVDKTAPTVSGITDQAVYCAEKQVLVSDGYLKSVTVNGTEVTLKDGAFTLSPASGIQTVVATDMAGNSKAVAVTVNSGHTWDTGKVTKEATCTQAGEMTYTCTVCGETKTEEIPALGHSWDAGTVTKAPTYTEKGIKTYTCSRCGETKTEEIPMLTDVKAPTGKISIDTDTWAEIMNNITFGHFYKETKDVVISGNDSESGVSKLYYFISDKAVAEESIKDLSWTEYTKPVGLNPESKAIVYAKIVDVCGNISYLNSDGLVFDGTAPLVTGVRDQQGYCEAQTVTVTDENLSQVTLNGEKVALQNNSFTVSPKAGAQAIIATDQAGNSTTVTVTVNDGHSWDGGKVTDPATQASDGEILYTCSICGDTKTEPVAAVSKISLSQTAYVYNGKSQKPVVSVIDRNGRAVSSNFYTVSYPNDTKTVGAKQAKLIFKGNYSGTKALTYTITPQATGFTKLTSAKRGFSAKWTARTGQSSGYQLQYSGSSKFSSVKTKVINGGSKSSLSVSGLGAKKKYYVRVRTYKTVGKERYYSAWSAVKTVTTKK